MHPSKGIKGSEGRELEGKRIVLALTGSVAAYRAPDLARELMRHGAEVVAVMSERARDFVGPELMKWATGNEVVTELTGELEHVKLSEFDMLIIAPCTANTVCKLANGIADTPVTVIASSMLGRKPLLLVPAMHRCLFDSPTTSNCLDRLKGLGVVVMEPSLEGDKAKMPPPEEVVKRAISMLKGRLSGLRVLVTAGPTAEHLDGVRVITNRSSGKMGCELAKAALEEGAEVTLIYGFGRVPPPPGPRLVRVETSEELAKALEEELKKGYDVVFFSSAVTDFRPSEPKRGKVSSEVEEWELKLVRVEKLVDGVKRLRPETFLVAFKAEYGVSDEELIDRAYRKLLESNADMVFANDVGRKGVEMGSDEVEGFLIDKDKNVVAIRRMSKRMAAKLLVEEVAKRL